MKDPARIGALARWHLLFGLTFAGLGMVLGIYMAISQNHSEMPAHAHIMLLGFVVSTIYALVYQLWLKATGVRLALVQTALHEIGATVLSIGLVLMFGGFATEDSVGPLLGIGAFLALGGVLLMIWQVARIGQETRAPDASPAISGAM